MTTKTHKPLQFSEEAEQSVLGGLMSVRACHVEVLSTVRAEDFYLARHRQIFAAINALSSANGPVDFITVSDWLRHRDELEAVGGLAYIGTLVNDIPGVTNTFEYAKIVRERAAFRALSATAEMLAASASNPDGRGLDEVLAEAETALENVRKHAVTRNTARLFGDHFGEYEEHFRRAALARAKGGVLGVPTGLPDLDYVLGGLQRQRFYGIAARPGAGKSALLNQIALHAARNNRRGIVITAEMNGLELFQRSVASETGTNLYQIINGADGVFQSTKRKTEAILGVPLWFDAETTALSGAIAQMALHKARYGIEWAAVDHIGLMETQRFPSRNDQIGFITRSLKKAAKQLDIAIVGLMQLNRGSETDSRKPRLSDLRDSGNIEQDLDAAIFLHTMQDKRGEKIKPLEIGVLKNRSGMSCWLERQFEFCGATQTIRAAGAPPSASDYGYDGIGA